HDVRRRLPQQSAIHAGARGLDPQAVLCRTRSAGVPARGRPARNRCVAPRRHRRCHRLAPRLPRLVCLLHRRRDLRDHEEHHRRTGAGTPPLMDLLPTPEQDEIVSSVGAFLTAELPMTRLRELHAEGAPVDDVVWRQCAAQGWFGLGLGEAAGGVGYGLAEEALLFREIGRHLAPGPFLATVLAARVAPRPQRDAILDGATRVALAELREATVGPDGVTGTVLLYDHLKAELAIVVAPEGAAVVELAGFTELTPSPCIDPSTSIATARAEGLRPLAYMAAAADPVFTRGAVLAAAMGSGVAEATRDLSAEHARSRIQFGKPIGVNQAIKHACTDMAVRAEAAATQT